ncbi:paraneoplastic antigen Ma6F-like [Panicum virgatum]|uniref:paraneoplastic antigen Ma6F-like n=1 Tax=Panicum virgatum TaxID=38727 RepID=UPI0019D5644B|nr:paraneoplastic antigen Ma6F-like [Panicum virgatum]
MPHTAPQPLPVVDIVAEAAKLQEAMARGTLESQLARAQESRGDAGQSGTAEAARADAEDEAGWGGVGRAAQPEVEAGRGGADAAAQPEVGTGEGEAGNAAQPEIGGAGAGGGAQECPTSQMEETRVPELARAGDEGAAAAAMVQMASASVGPLMELPQSSGECGDSEDVLGTGTSEGPGHGAIIQSRVPLEFLRSDQEEEAVWKA